MSRIECKRAKSFVLPHLHSIRLMWSTASEPGLTYIVNSVDKTKLSTLIMVRDQARVVCSCFMAALLPGVWNIYYDMFQWRWFRRSIDVIFYCFREKSPASVTKVPAVAGSRLLFWTLHVNRLLGWKLAIVAQLFVCHLKSVPDCVAHTMQCTVMWSFIRVYNWRIKTLKNFYQTNLD